MCDMSDAMVQPEMPAFPRMRGVGADGFINIDIACRQCGYDLRALSADAKCPECGTDVLGSLRSEQLGSADPNWLKTLANGTQWLMATLVLQPLLVCFAPIAGPPGAGHMLTLVQFVALPTWLIGVWMLTRPDPSGRGELQYGAWRRAWVIAAIATASFDMFHVFSVVERWLPDGPLLVGRVIIYAVVAFIGFQYLARFARRLPDSYRIAAAGLSYSLPLSYLALATFVATDGAPGIFLLAPMLALFICSQIVHFVLLRSLARRLRAELNWRVVGP